MAKIYLIYNIENGKKYVGATSNCVSQRFCQHIDSSYRNIEKNRNLFHKEIRDSGENVFNVFKYTILCECSEKEKNEKEKYYIKKIKPEYNEAHKNCYLETLKEQIIKEYNSGKTIDELRIKYKCRQRYISTILKNENIFIDKGRNAFSKKIYLFNENGEVVKEWLNSGLCSKELHIDKGNIRCCSIKNTKENILYFSAKGYHFKYNKETPKDMFKVINKNGEEFRFKSKEALTNFFKKNNQDKKIIYSQIVRNRKTVYGCKVEKLYEHRN